MKRGFPTDPSLIVLAGGGGSSVGAQSPGSGGKAKGPGRPGERGWERSGERSGERLVELRPLLREVREADSGLGPSFLGSSYEASMLSADHSLTPKSNGSDVSDLNTPQPLRRRFLYRSSEGSPLGSLKAAAKAVAASPLQLSSGGGSEYRFDGASLSSVCASGGLTKLGSPETQALQTLHSENHRLQASSSRGISRRLEMAPADGLGPLRPGTPSRCLPFSPSKDPSGGGADFLGGFPLSLAASLSTSTPLRTELPLNPTQAAVGTFPAPVFPGSPGRKRAVPLTPTPIKRAMAYVHSTSKTTPPRLPSDLQDVHEMIRKDSGPLDSSCQGIEYTTPSKLMRWEGGLAEAGLGPGLAAEGPLLVSGWAADPPVLPAHAFQPPPFTPEKMSAAWCRIALGATSPQRELTAKAKALLAHAARPHGLPPVSHLQLQPQVTPEKASYAHL